MNVVGLDIGHSAVKIALNNRAGIPSRVLFPSVVCPAMQISDESEHARAAKETVSLGTRRYFFGETAQVQSGSRGGTMGLNEKWIYSPEHAVLLMGAWRTIQETYGGAIQDAMLVLGLPTHLFATQRDALKDLVEAHLPVKAGNVRVMPQAMGPYHTFMLDPDGTPVAERTMGAQSWAVVEIGHYTTDFGLIARGRWVEQACGTCSGVHLAAERVVRQLRQMDIALGLLDAQPVLATGKVKHMGRFIDVSSECSEAVGVVVDEAIDTATRLFEPWVGALDGVIVAGGGARLLYGALARRWPHVHLAENPRFAIAEGMRRFGTAIAGVRRLAAVQG